MDLYALFFILLVLLRYALVGHRRHLVRVYYIVWFMLFVFAAFRYDVGCDWSGYLNQWNVLSRSGLEYALTTREPFWWVSMYGLQSLGFSYPWLNVLSSAVFFIGVHVLARRQPDPLGFLILMFPILIINMPMSGIRQGLAIGLMCIAFAAFIDKKMYWFVGWVFLAATFHSSAIVFLLLTPLVNGNFTSQRLCLAALLALPGGLVLLSGNAADIAISRYVETDLNAAGAVFRVGLLLLTSLFYFIVLRRKWRYLSPDDYVLVSVGALIMGSMLLFVQVSSVIGDRLGYYLIPIQVMIFARVPYLALGKSRHMLSAAPYLGLGLVFLIWTSLSAHFNQCYMPYGTWVFGAPHSSPYFH